MCSIRLFQYVNSIWGWSHITVPNETVRSVRSVVSFQSRLRNCFPYFLRDYPLYSPPIFFNWTLNLSDILFCTLIILCLMPSALLHRRWLGAAEVSWCDRTSYHVVHVWLRLITAAESRDTTVGWDKEGLERSSKLVSTRLHVAMITRIWGGVLGQDAVWTLIWTYQEDIIRLGRPYETHWYCLHRMEKNRIAQCLRSSIIPSSLLPWNSA